MHLYLVLQQPAQEINVHIVLFPQRLCKCDGRPALGIYDPRESQSAFLVWL